MRNDLIWHLVRKDVGFARHLIGLSSLLGAIAIALMCIEGKGFFYAGSVLLITILMTLGVHAAVSSAVGERKEQTLAFVMTLPISLAEYSLGKVLANLSVFFVPWTLMLAGCAAAILAVPALQDGLMAYTFVLFGGMAVYAVIVLCVALVTESMAWTVPTFITLNLGFQGLMFGAAAEPAMASAMFQNSVTWPPSAIALIAAEALLVLLTLAVGFYLQSRKTDFL